MTDIKVPQFPESIQEGTLAALHKKVGDTVARDEKIADIETDKVVLEVLATADGVVQEIKKKQGDVVLSQELLMVLSEGSGTPSAPAPKEAPAKQEPAAKTVDAGPAARRAAAEQEIDLTQVEGSGKHGRVTVADLSRPEQRVPMTRLRQRIAERLLTVMHDTAMLTTFNEVNMKPIQDLRAQYKEEFAKKHGVKLGLMSFFVKAVVDALKQFPSVNASIDGSDVVYHGYYDVSIAVSTDKGLVVPVIRNANRLNMAGIEKAIIDFSTRAKAGKLTLEEMMGGTFTITNGGGFGSLLSTPILNPPQSAILGMHAILDRVVVEAGQMVIRPMMYLALSYDHRIVDGKDSVTFLKTIKELLEKPTVEMLEL